MKYLIMVIILLLMISCSKSFNEKNAQNSDILNQGQMLYESRCSACHQLGENTYGPDHCGLAGRKVGSAREYRYSKAMLSSDIIWDIQILNDFMKSPQSVIPGNFMSLTGIMDQNTRRLIAYYLIQTSQSSLCS